MSPDPLFGSQAFEYRLLPFRFERRGDGTVLLTNEVGEYLALPTDAFEDFIHHRIAPQSRPFLDLMGKQFAVAHGDEDAAIDLLATKYRTKKRFLNDFTSLHMVIPTLGCNSRCVYCQVSSRDPQEGGRTMSKETADMVVETIFRSRSPAIKIEFQGGEPLLRFDLVKHFIVAAERANRRHGKLLEFVVCTNLTLLTVEHLKFFRDHGAFISTSLDGPKDIHDANRPLRDGTGSYEKVVRNLELAQKELGADRVSALMTITGNNLRRLRDVVDEYVRRGLSSIFFRPLNPFGAAIRNGLLREYDVFDYLDAYRDAIEHIVALNKGGTYFVEEFTALLLHRILTPFGSGFVDLQSPSGCGISGAVYNYDGNVYVSDEARMLAEMDDPRFRMGNLHEDSYEALFHGPLVRLLAWNSVTETLPGCSTCVYCPYCGIDPIRNYSEQGDTVGNCYLSDTCRKNLAIFNDLFSTLHNGDQKTIDVYWSWVTRRHLAEVRVGV